MQRPDLLHFHERALQRLEALTLAPRAILMPTGGRTWRVVPDRVTLPAATTIEIGLEVAMHERAGIVTALRVHGVETLVILGVGISLHDDAEPQSIDAVTDHINLFGDHPLIGADVPDFGTRFVDMSRAYGTIPDSVLREAGLTARIYAGCTPEYASDPVHRRFMAELGANACGPCIVPETLAAAYCGVKVLAFVLSVGADLLSADLDEQTERALTAMRTVHALLGMDTRQT